MQCERDKQPQIDVIDNNTAASLLALLQNSDHATHQAWLALGLHKGWVANAQRDALEMSGGKLDSKEFPANACALISA